MLYVPIIVMLDSLIILSAFVLCYVGGNESVFAFKSSSNIPSNNTESTLNQQQKLSSANVSNNPSPNTIISSNNASVTSNITNGNITNSEEINSTHTLYNNDYHHIKFIAPSEWASQEGNGSSPLIVLVSPDEAATIEPYVAQTPEELRNPISNLGATISSYSNFSNFKVLSANTGVSLTQKPVYSLDASYTDPTSGQQRIRILSTIIGDQEYSVRFISDVSEFTKYLPIFESVTKSFQLQATNNSTSLYPR